MHHCLPLTTLRDDMRIDGGRRSEGCGVAATWAGLSAGATVLRVSWRSSGTAPVRRS